MSSRNAMQFTRSKTFEQGAMNFTILLEHNAFYNHKDGWASLNIIR